MPSKFIPILYFIHIYTEYKIQSDIWSALSTVRYSGGGGGGDGSSGSVVGRDSAVTVSTQASQCRLHSYVNCVTFSLTLSQFRNQFLPPTLLILTAPLWSLLNLGWYNQVQCIHKHTTLPHYHNYHIPLLYVDVHARDPNIYMLLVQLAFFVEEICAKLKCVGIIDNFRAERAKYFLRKHSESPE